MKPSWATLLIENESEEIIFGTDGWPRDFFWMSTLVIIPLVKHLSSRKETRWIWDMTAAGPSFSRTCLLQLHPIFSFILSSVILCRHSSSGPVINWLSRSIRLLSDRRRHRNLPVNHVSFLKQWSTGKLWEGKVLRVLPSGRWLPPNQGWVNFWETRLVTVMKSLYRSCATELTCQGILLP